MPQCHFVLSYLITHSHWDTKNTNSSSSTPENLILKDNNWRDWSEWNVRCLVWLTDRRRSRENVWDKKRNVGHVLWLTTKTRESSRRVRNNENRAASPIVFVIYGGVQNHLTPDDCKQSHSHIYWPSWFSHQFDEHFGAFPIGWYARMLRTCFSLGSWRLKLTKSSGRAIRDTREGHSKKWKRKQLWDGWIDSARMS